MEYIQRGKELLMSVAEFIIIKTIKTEEDNDYRNQIPNNSGNQHMFGVLSNTVIQTTESKSYSESNRESNSSRRQFSPSSKSSISKQSKSKKFIKANDYNEENTQNIIQNAEDGHTLTCSSSGEDSKKNNKENIL